jgi:CBS domain-containing protein/anti-sigma regulatory factor (Ser/Thr protein kinase)
MVSEAKPEGLGRLQELTYELRVEQVMSTQVISVTPGDSMQYVKDLLRQHRISGTPVVNASDGALVGIVSVEDVIKAADSGEMRALVGEKMSSPAITVGAKEPLAEAVKRFARHKFGRLPVVDEERLVGILTPGDIIARLLVTLERRYHEDLARTMPHRIFAELSSDDTRLALAYAVRARDFDRAGDAATRLRRGLVLLGLDREVVRRATVAAYEAEMNIVIHSVGGKLVGEVRPERILIQATDDGPGIPDVAQALEPGFTTAPDWIRELGFGAGMGLNNIQHCADEFHIESKVGVGTQVQAVLYLPGAEEGQP